MARRPLIAIIGSGSDLEPAVSNAFALGRLVAENGWIVITGGRDAAVMKAANEGAKNAAGLTIGILPNRDAEISPDVDVAIITDTGEARNNILVLSADVVIACGVDGAGTASEVSLALKNGKRVIILAANEATKKFFTSIAGPRISYAESCQEAVTLVHTLLASE